MGKPLDSQRNNQACSHCRSHRVREQAFSPYEHGSIEPEIRDFLRSFAGIDIGKKGFSRYWTQGVFFS
jgi:hypothetical protein